MARMKDDRYRLIFRGELLEGQHQAVVKKRLAQALKLDAAKAEVLFSGKAVVLKRDADTKTAAGYQKLFRSAGARLRVLPVETSTPTESPRAVDQSEREIHPEPEREAPEGSTIALAPLGSPVLDPAEAGGAAEKPSAEVDTSALQLAEPGAVIGAETSRSEPDVDAPDTHRISLAETGVDLTYDDLDLMYEELDIDLDWSLAEPGVDLVELHLPQEPVIDLDSIDYELAPPGTALGADTQGESNELAAPDTSHLSVEPLPEKPLTHGPEPS